MTPGRSSDSWLNVAETTTEFGTRFRSLLLSTGFKPADLDGIGAHSLKTACLSWAAKAGLDRDCRRLLGYHSVPGDRSVDTYSRDTLAGPLRKLDSVLASVRSGKFDPDATRSGLFRMNLPDAAASAEPSPVEEVDVSAEVSSTSSSGRSSSSASEDGFSEKDPEDLAVEEEKDVGIMVMNPRTKYLHVAVDPNHLLCGKTYLPTWSRHVSLDGLDARKCSKCF